jgi:thiamine biosynthesis protein ThiS
LKLIINGKEQTFNEQVATIGALLDELGLREKRFVIEYNGEILKKEKQDEQALLDGDRLEIVHFVGGG